MTILFALLISMALCLGPTVVALRLAARNHGRTRAAYAAVTLAAALPFLLVEVTAGVGTVQSFDGYCHHAPDVRYACSLPRAVLEGVLPSSAFSLLVYLVVGAFSSLWGAVVVLPAWWLIRRGEKRRRRHHAVDPAEPRGIRT